MTRRAPAARTYLTSDGGGRNIDPVAQLGGRYDMRALPADSDTARRHAARLTVCANAADAADARELFRILGLDKP